MLNKIFNSNANDAVIPDGQRIYAIGDVHGCVELLDQLLAKIDEDAGDTKAQIVFLGDYVDRGPDTKGVLDRLTALKKKKAGHVFLKGNHEALMLDFLAAPEDMDHWLEWGGLETLESYGVDTSLGRSNITLCDELKKAMPAPHIELLENLSLTFEIGDYVFVHAGLRPGVALKDQQEEDLLWIRKKFHQTAVKERPEQTVIHGHQPVDDAHDAGWRVNVDTGAVWSGQLTAVVLEGKTRRFLST